MVKFKTEYEINLSTINLLAKVGCPRLSKSEPARNQSEFIKFSLSIEPSTKSAVPKLAIRSAR